MEDLSSFPLRPGRRKAQAEPLNANCRILAPLSRGEPTHRVSLSTLLELGRVLRFSPSQFVDEVLARRNGNVHLPDPAFGGDSTGDGKKDVRKGGERLRHLLCLGENRDARRHRALLENGAIIGPV